MTTKANYTSDEWKVVADAPMFAGLSVAKVDMSVVSFAKEFTALIRFLTEAGGKYPSNELIRAIVADASAKKDQGEPQGPRTVDEAMALIQRAAHIVEAKAPAKEAGEYKGFLVRAAEVVAKASGEGFFGTGEAVSDKEKKHLERLRKALHVQ